MIEQILQADRHLQVDQVERARDIYQRVVDTDPGNAIAVVGLARCALADGDDRRAYELAAEALEIDPENDMARRMEARLDEILAGRGEKVQRPPAAATPAPREMRTAITEPMPAAGQVTPGAQAAPAGPMPLSGPTGPAGRARPAAPKAPDRQVRKSLLDRLMGR